MRLLRDWGQASKYNHVVPGYNYRMDGVQGAVLKVKMNYIEAWTEGRRAVASHYDRLLAGKRYGKPAPRPDCRHVYHVYAIEVAERDKVQTALHATGVATGIHYPIPVHLQKAYADLGYGWGDFPVTEAVAGRFLSLPIYPELRPDQVAEVVQRLESASSIRGELPGVPSLETT
jgi:dTDP-4-amino-4,6-dideoxygalactose transaminase